MHWKFLEFAVLAGVAIGIQAAPAPAETTLDYAFYKSRVEPIFLQKRPDHVRCYVCHSEATNAFKLVHMEKGQTAYTDEDSRKNFETASRLVMPGDPAKSRLLLQPLAPQAGGNPYHSGGRQFSSKNDPAWKTIAQWVSGAKAAGK